MSRHEMLMWVNECLQSEFSKIEQLHTGEGYGLFTEILFPGMIQLKRIKYNSKLELDWINNWKLVQTAWGQLAVDKIIPVAKLITGKFHDNFEFLQWFRKFFDANFDGHAYNPSEMRNYVELPKENKLRSYANNKPPSMQGKTTLSSAIRNPPLQQRALSKTNVFSVNNINNALKNVHINITQKQTSTKSLAPQKPVVRSVQKASMQNVQKTVSPNVIEELNNLKNLLEKTRGELNDSEENVSGLESERDFYFTKLRKIEVFCQQKEAEQNIEISKILEILYETGEGFVPPDDPNLEDDGVVINGNRQQIHT